MTGDDTTTQRLTDHSRSAVDIEQPLSADPSSRRQRRIAQSLVGRCADLRRLTVALVVSTTSDQFTLVALLWYVLQTTNSSLALSAVVLANRLPAAVTAPVAGWLIDRVRPARLMAAHSACRAILLAVIPALHALGHLPLVGILLPAAAMGMLAPLTDVGVRVVVPRVVPRQDLTAANGILSIGEQFPYLVGPALGGAVVAAAGANALLLPALGSVVVAWVVSRVRDVDVSRPTPEEDAASRGRGWGGFGVLLRDPAVRALMLLTVVYFFAYGPLEPALPIYARNSLHGGAAGYGALWSAVGAGALVGLVLVRPLSRFRPGIINAFGAIGWGVLLLPLPWMGSLTGAVVLLFLAGVVWAPYVAIEVSVIQQLTPRSAHGAVFGARRSALVVASPGGAALGGVLLRHLSAETVILGSGAACVLAGLACLGSPAVRRVPPP